MEILLEQESNLTTLAALSSAIAVKSDNGHAVNISRHVQTDIAAIKASPNEVLDFKQIPGAFNNLPVCEPVEIYFKDIAFYAQKMFSQSE